MNLDLSEFVGTLCLGGGILLAGIILLRVYCQIELSQIMERIDGRLLGNTFLITVTAFTLGMIAEDVSDNYVDTDGHFFQRTLDFPQEANLRFRVLFGKDPLCSKEELGDAGPEFKPGPLSQQYARLDLMQAQDPKFGALVEAAVERRIPVSTLRGQKEVEDVCRQARGLTNSLYYQAKNIVYGEANYFRELSLIQNRIDFARSLSVLAVLFLGAVLTAFTARSAQLLFRMKVGDPGARPEWASLRMILASTVTLSVSAAVVFFAARNAYASEEQEFDRRAFGYYASMKQEAACTPHAEASD
jgi:hypothetical protein